MNEIYNAIKNTFDNRIKEYDKKNLFKLSMFNNLEKEYAVKYLGVYQGVDFSIEIEYIDKQILFSTFTNVSHSPEASFEIVDFMKFILSMPKGDLIKQIEYEY